MKQKGKEPVNGAENQDETSFGAKTAEHTERFTAAQKDKQKDGGKHAVSQ